MVRAIAVPLLSAKVTVLLFKTLTVSEKLRMMSSLAPIWAPLLGVLPLRNGGTVSDGDGGK